VSPIIDVSRDPLEAAGPSTPTASPTVEAESESDAAVKPADAVYSVVDERSDIEVAGPSTPTASPTIEAEAESESDTAVKPADAVYSVVD